VFIIKNELQQEATPIYCLEKPKQRKNKCIPVPVWWILFNNNN